MAQEIKHVTLTWDRELEFHAGEPGKPAILMDADNALGPGPMVTLLCAAACCTGSDVILILRKMRVELQEFRIDIAGTRREEEPRRYIGIHVVYRIKGNGVDEAKARRAIDLSLEKYCSVFHSLAPDIAVDYELVLG